MRKASISEQSQIEFLLEQDIDTLFIDIGRVEAAKTNIQMSPDTALISGKKWFEENKKRLFNAVCIQWQYCNKSKNKSLQDKINLIVTLGDIIAGLTFGVPPFHISTLLVKMGLDDFCDCSK